MKDKHLFFLLVPVCAVLSFFFLYMAVTAMKGPVALSDSEVEFYKDAAISYWNKEDAPHTSNVNDSIRYIPSKDRVTVAPYNIFKETVTVIFDSNETIVEVNEPNVSFTGCIIFHSILATIAIGGAMLFMVYGVSEVNKSKQIEKAR